ncbi:MAG: MarR family winged helix-turn-helix transcriptional regulator [Mycobacterium sp.]
MTYHIFRVGFVGVWLSDDEQRVWRDYLLMGVRLQAAMNRQLQRDCGLSLADYDVLVALSESGAMRIAALGEAVAWEQSRVSHHLTRMRSRGLVEREGISDDRRGAVVSITEAGRAALRAAAAGHAALVREVVFDGLSAARLSAVGEWTSTVLDRLR